MNPLAQAIADFETAQTNLSNADGANTAAQAKLDSAKTSADTAAQADRDAVTSYNEKIDALVAELQKAKLPVGTGLGPAVRGLSPNTQV